MAVVITRRSPTVPVIPVVTPEVVELPATYKKTTAIPRGRGYLRAPRDTPKRVEKSPEKEYTTPVFNDSIDYPYYFKCETCHDKKRVVVFNECENCYGKGCSKCGGTGEVKSYINCQSCNAPIKVYK